MIVVDASVLAPVVTDAGPDGRRLRERLRGETVAVPDLARIEAMSVIRRHLAGDRLTAEQAQRAIDGLLDLPLIVYATGPLLRRAWDLRTNVTSYDGCYVALAEALDCPLVTADQRLARAPGLSCAVEPV